MIYDKLINLESGLFMSILQVSKVNSGAFDTSKNAENSIFKNLQPRRLLNKRLFCRDVQVNCARYVLFLRIWHLLTQST